MISAPHESFLAAAAGFNPNVSHVRLHGSMLLFAHADLSQGASPPALLLSRARHMPRDLVFQVLSMAARQGVEFGEFNRNAEMIPLIIAAIAMIVSAASQIYLINATMSSGKVIIAVPSYSSLTIILTIVGSSIFYGGVRAVIRDDLMSRRFLLVHECCWLWQISRRWMSRAPSILASVLGLLGSASFCSRFYRLAGTTEGARRHASQNMASVQHPRHRSASACITCPRQPCRTHGALVLMRLLGCAKRAMRCCLRLQKRRRALSQSPLVRIIWAPLATAAAQPMAVAAGRQYQIMRGQARMARKLRRTPNPVY